MKRARILLAALLTGCAPLDEVELVAGALVTVGADGTGCAGAGWSWVAATKTCTMTADLVNQTVEVTDDGVTLDCAGHTVCYVSGSTCADAFAQPPAPQDGIAVVGRRRVGVLNCRVKGFDCGLSVRESEEITVQNLRTTGDSAYLNPPPAQDVAWGVQRPMQAIYVTNTNHSTFEDLDLQGMAEAGIDLRHGHFNYNTFRRVKVRDALKWAVVMKHNDLVANTTSDGNVFEDIEAEAASSRSGGSGGFIQGSSAFLVANTATGTVIRRFHAHPKWGTGGNFGSGVELISGATKTTVEDSTLVGIYTAGIRLLRGLNDPGSLIARRNIVVASGGGIIVPALSSAVLTDNVLCNGDTTRYSLGTTVYADVSVQEYSGTAGMFGVVVGAGNTCAVTNRCVYASGVYTCTDGLYQDTDHGAGIPCARACP